VQIDGDVCALGSVERRRRSGMVAYPALLGSRRESVREGLAMAGLRFCAYQYQHLSLDSLRERWRAAEQCGFDVVWNCDTVVERDRPRHVIFDGPATLTMMAADTSRIRVGTLVTSIYFRQPVTLAKAAVTVDHLSGGRVELAVGVGDPCAGAKAAGWTGRLVNGSLVR
jgi:alkanesulfonate monooxygenase SsuD/methylene tetrahydromethanopterin reductase-like flavin-dependent oxidoreductase (luciferase family)